MMTLRVLMFIITIAGVLLSFAIILTVFLGKKIQDSKGRQKLNLLGKLDVEVNTLVMLLLLGILQTLAPIGVMVWKPEILQATAESTPLFLSITGEARVADDAAPDSLSDAEPITVMVTQGDSTVIKQKQADPTEGTFFFENILIQGPKDEFQIKAQQGKRKAIKPIQITLQSFEIVLR